MEEMLWCTGLFEISSFLWRVDVRVQHKWSACAIVLPSDSQVALIHYISIGKGKKRKGFHCIEMAASNLTELI